MTGLVSTLATIWRLAAPYFRHSDDRWAGRVLLAAIVAIELAVVGISVLINQWNARFFNAIQDRNVEAFTTELMWFALLAAVYILLAVYQLYLNQWLQIRWRRWLTVDYLSRWLGRANHYRMQLLGDAADNPDQRLAEDVQLFVDRTLSLSIGLLGAAVSLASFVIILWSLSQNAPLVVFGVTWSVPGYLVWAALIYAAVGTLITHLIGRALIPLNFNQQRFEADFRFNLVRVRENGEQIALLEGEQAEQQRLTRRFDDVVSNWLAIMLRQKKLTFFTAGYAQISVIFPYLVVSPAYFSGHLQLGGLTQTASAFGSVQGSLSFFVSAYRQLAEWRAVIARLAGFEAGIAQGEALAAAQPAISVKADADGAIRIGSLDIALPSGKPLVEARDLSLRPRERVLLTGPSGSGKSTLFRAIAGIWPFGAGVVHRPAGATVMVLPQRPYLPIGTLADAVSYPASSGRFASARIGGLIAAVGLPALAARVEEEAHWNRMLSLGEQQRLAVARAILHAPDYLFLDEATASLDEAAETQLYTLLKERLPDSAIISIGHRSTLRAYHERRIELVTGDGYARLRPAAGSPAG